MGTVQISIAGNGLLGPAVGNALSCQSQVFKKTVDSVFSQKRQ